jgi:hypothetical protein
MATEPRVDTSTEANPFSGMIRPEHPLLRAIALMAASCVLLLAVFAASPTLHAGLHAKPAGVEKAGVPAAEADHTCAVTLFAQGVVPLLVFCLLVLARPAIAGLKLYVGDDLVVGQPHYRLVPSHAPPAPELN